MKRERKIAIGWQDIGERLMPVLDGAWCKGFFIKDRSSERFEKELKHAQIPFVNISYRQKNALCNDNLYREICTMLRGYDRVLLYGALCSRTFRIALPLLLKALSENGIEQIDLFASLAFSFESKELREMEQLNLETLQQSGLPIQIELYDNDKIFNKEGCISKLFGDIIKEFQIYLKREEL